MRRTIPEDKKCHKKLLHFILHGKDGNLQPFEMSHSDGVSMTALIMPLDDGVEKDMKKGIHYVRFGCMMG